MYMKKLIGIVLTSLALGGTAFGVSEVVDTDLDYENGKAVYEVEVEQGKNEYEYEVDVATGAVIETEKERDDDARTNQTTKTTEVKPQTETKPVAKTQPVVKTESTSDDIGKEKAKEIALQNADVSADQVVWEEVERDYDDGRLEYQIEFRVGNKEYDYEIDGKTGNILERDFDLDDDRYDDDDDRYDDDYDDRWDD